MPKLDLYIALTYFRDIFFKFWRNLEANIFESLWLKFFRFELDFRFELSAKSAFYSMKLFIYFWGNWIKLYPTFSVLLEWELFCEESFWSLVDESLLKINQS